jgi:hypothetical protein
MEYLTGIYKVRLMELMRQGLNDQAFDPESCKSFMKYLVSLQEYNLRCRLLMDRHLYGGIIHEVIASV